MGEYAAGEPEGGQGDPLGDKKGHTEDEDVDWGIVSKFHSKTLLSSSTLNTSCPHLFSFSMPKHCL